MSHSHSKRIQIKEDELGQRNFWLLISFVLLIILMGLAIQMFFAPLERPIGFIQSLYEWKGFHRIGLFS